MAQVLAVNDIIKAQLWCSDSEQASVNTFYYKVTAVGGSIGTLEDFNDTFSTTMATLLKACINQTAAFDGSLSQIVFPPPLMVAVKQAGDAGNGTGGADAAARQVAGLISWTTPLAGPGGRGRTYMPFTSRGDSQGIGIPTAAYMANVASLAVAISTYTTFTVGGRSATFEFGLKKRNSSTFTPITDGHVNEKWATQKKRGSYGRANTSPF